MVLDTDRGYAAASPRQLSSVLAGEIMTTEARQYNPWFSIWIRPQKTIAVIIDEDPKRLVPDLAVIAGFVFALEKSMNNNIGDQFRLIAIILVSFFGGALNGRLFLYFVSAVIHWTGKWLKGSAEVEHI
jgi:hypothetical protein